MTIKVLYHDKCSDGFGAAYATWKFFMKYPPTVARDEIEYIPVNYNEPPPPITAQDVLYIVDFSYPRQVLLDMMSRCKELYVLDHHDTARAELSGLPNCHFDNERSGAMITWNYFHADNAPKLLRYVQDRDLWRFKLPHSKEVNDYIATVPKDFMAWQALEQEMELNFDKVIAKSQVLYDQKIRTIKALSENRWVMDCFKPQLGRFVICNAPSTFASDLGNYLLQQHPDCEFSMSWYVAPDNSVRISLRAAGKVHVGNLSRIHFNGGGHANAAGGRLPLQEFFQTFL